MASQTPLDDSIIVDTSSRDLESQEPESRFDDSLIDPALLLSLTPTIPIPLASRTQQTPEIQEALLNTLLDQYRVSKYTDSGFKKEAQSTVLVVVQTISTSQISNKQIKSRVDWFKSMWKEWCTLEDNSGFGWDEPTQLFTAEDSVQREYLKVSNNN